jgi:hypothetical protein
MDPLVMIVLVLFVLWLLGAFIVPIGGSLIHLLLVLVIVLVLYRLLTGQRI